MEKIAERKTRKTRSSRTESDADWVGAMMTEEKPTLASRMLIFLLCASLVVTVALYGTVDAWALGLLAVGAAIVGLLWLADAWKTRELKFSRSLLQLPPMGLIVIGLIQLLPLRDVSSVNNLLTLPASAAFSLDAVSTRFFLVQLAAFLIYFAAALAFVNNQKRLRTVAATIIVFGILAAIFAIMQSVVSPNAIYGLREPAGAIPFGTYVNRHHFAALMEMTIGLTLGLIYAGGIGRETRALQIFAVVIMGVALILTASRGAMLSLLGVIAFLTIASALRHKTDDDDEGGNRKSALRRKFAVVGGGLALIVMLFGTVLFLGGSGELTRGVGLGDAPTSDVSNGRLHFWSVAWQIIRDNPILGVGLDAFGAAFPRYDTWNGTFRVERAHNDYLQILADAGVLGFLCVAMFIAILFRSGFKVLGTTRDRFRRGVCLGALAGIVGILIHSIFDFPLRTPANALYFFTLCALAVVSINYPKLHRRQRSSRSRKDHH